MDESPVTNYDAWNRLVGVTCPGPTADPQPTAVYRYDGLGRRTSKTVTNSGDKDASQWFYYNQRWQLLEVATGDTAQSHQARRQFVWGTRYIDEAICMDVDTGDDGDCTNEESRRFFYMQDANWNVVALAETTEVDQQPVTSIVERYEYDPYGTVRIYRGSASPGAPEQMTGSSQSLKWLNADLASNPILYGGHYLDNETNKYKAWFRDLDPYSGRWMQRDPSGYGNPYASGPTGLGQGGFGSGPMGGFPPGSYGPPTGPTGGSGFGSNSQGGRALIPDFSCEDMCAIYWG
ncbi:MAG TPA: hypothetical protein VLM89_11790, partial [Phycisphaerae bacterium]|nr:hypothetical protein [Phycisphaerae bacterium]